MDEDQRSVRETLHETIQSTVATDKDLPEGAMLLGWCTIAEWIAPDGQQWLSIVDGDSRAQACPQWKRQGYLHNALFDPQGFVPEGDEDDA